MSAQTIISIFIPITILILVLIGSYFMNQLLIRRLDQDIKQDLETVHQIVRIKYLNKKVNKSDQELIKRQTDLLRTNIDKLKRKYFLPESIKSRLSKYSLQMIEIELKLTTIKNIKI